MSRCFAGAVTTGTTRGGIFLDFSCAANRSATLGHHVWRNTQAPLVATTSAIVRIVHHSLPEVTVGDGLAGAVDAGACSRGRRSIDGAAGPFEASDLAVDGTERLAVIGLTYP